MEGEEEDRGGRKVKMGRKRRSENSKLTTQNSKEEVQRGGYRDIAGGWNVRDVERKLLQKRITSELTRQASFIQENVFFFHNVAQ